jgi:hypothetical protein
MSFVIKAARIDRSKYIVVQSAKFMATPLEHERLLILTPDCVMVIVDRFIVSEEYAIIASCEPTIPSEHRLAVIIYIYGGSITVTTDSWAYLYKLAEHIKLDCLIKDLMKKVHKLDTYKITGAAFKLNLQCKYDIFRDISRNFEEYTSSVQYIREYMTDANVADAVSMDTHDNNQLDKFCFDLIVQTYSGRENSVELMRPLFLKRSFKWITEKNLNYVLTYCSRDMLISALIKIVFAEVSK